MAHSEGSAQLVRLEGKVGSPARLYKVGLAAPGIRAFDTVQGSGRVCLVRCLSWSSGKREVFR
jgi:hypothetical protein